MNAPTSTQGSNINDLYERRGQNFPTRTDSIESAQDRQDWFQVVYDIITHNGDRPRNMQTLIVQQGAEKNNLLRSKTEKGGRRSLWSILVCLINSYSSQKVTMPTASDVNRILRTIENACAPAQTSDTVSQSVTSGVQKALSASPDTLFSGPVIAHIDRRRAQVAEVFSHTLSSADGDTAESLPNVNHFNVLTKGQKVIFLLYYGYKGEGHDPSENDSYDVGLRQSLDDISQTLDKTSRAVYQQLCIARKRINESNGGAPTLGGELGEEEIPTRSTVVHIQESGANILGTPPSPVQADTALPAFLRKGRIIPTPIPRREQTTPLNHSGETAQTSGPIKGAVVVAPPRPIPQKHIYTPPSQSPRIPPQNGKANLSRTFRPTQGTATDEDVETFVDLVSRATEVKLLPGNPKLTITPESLDKRPREIPQFTSYRAALVWAQEQRDWVETLQTRTKANPLYKDDMALRVWLQKNHLTEIIPLLDQMKVLSGQRISFNTLMDQIIAPLPEEKITLENIQSNTKWMEMIGGAFQKHEARDYEGFMRSMENILSDEVLAGGIFDLMPECETNDPMAILALLTNKNWTQEDATHYQNRTPKDVLGYKPGKYAGLDKVLGIGPHVKGKVLIAELQSISIKVPIGESRWPRYREYQSPEVSLYDIIITLVKKDKGDVESPKTLFHKLEQILG